MTYFVVSCERNANEYETADQLRPFIDEIGCDGFRVWASKGSALSPSRGEWRWADSNTDNAIRAARAAGGRVLYFTLVGCPANGTMSGKITFEAYTNGPYSWIRDPTTGDAHAPAFFDPDLPWIKNPDRVDPSWAHEFGRRAMARYESVIDGLLIWNEPDDRTYNPRMMPPYEDEWGIYEKDIYGPISAGAIDARAAFDAKTDACDIPKPPQPLIHGPETAYASGLEAMLRREKAAGARFSDVITFHNYGGRPIEDGGEPGETLNNAIKNLDEKLHIVDPYRDGRMIGLSEGGDSGLGWWPEYIEYAIKVAGDYLLYVDYHPKEHWLRPDGHANTAGLEASKMMASLRAMQQRRRPSQNGVA